MYECVSESVSVPECACVSARARESVEGRCAVKAGQWSEHQNVNMHKSDTAFGPQRGPRWTR